jgi:hypothetical protein
MRKRLYKPTVEEGFWYGGVWWLSSSQNGSEVVGLVLTNKQSNTVVVSRYKRDLRNLFILCQKEIYLLISNQNL